MSTRIGNWKIQENLHKIINNEAGNNPDDLKKIAKYLLDVVKFIENGELIESIEGELSRRERRR